MVKAKRMFRKPYVLLLLLVVGVATLGGIIAYEPKNTFTQVNTVQTNPITVKKLLAEKSSYVDKKVTLTGKVLFESLCPPSESGGSNSCTAKAYLVADDETYLQATTQKLTLYENGKFAGCGEPVPQSGCDGWVNNQLYSVTGTLEYLVAGGKQTDMLILVVLSKKLQ